MKNLLILLTFILAFVSCKDNHNSQGSLYQFQHSADTTFKKEIPTTGYSYKSNKYKEKQLGLENIESGFENLQIRLWVDYALYKGKELYIIKNKKGKWSAEFYKMMTERTTENEDSIVSKEIKNVTPKSGWDSLLTNLVNLKIVTLPNMDNRGKPSYDLYVLGHLNFLNLSLAKAFWNNQQGGGVLVFQTQKPSQKEFLLNSWKQFYKDSLFVHSYKGSDFTLDEIMAWYKHDTTKPKKANIFANLTSYSVDAYKNWGITDSIISAGLSMKQFMGDWGGEPLKTRLFNSITELYVIINQQEFKEIKSALLAVGYEENKNSFTHPSNPPIYITISEENIKSKYSKVKFKLNRSIADKEIVFSPIAKLKLSGTEGWFVFS